jgi:hypothetical protein
VELEDQEILTEQLQQDLKDLLQFFQQLHQQVAEVELEQVVILRQVVDQAEVEDHLQDQLQEMQIQDLVIVHQ